MQERLARKLDLEILLSKVKPHLNPSPNLEQYTIPADVAAQMLYLAAYTYHDIVDKTVLDLGCGTGRLALGAAFLGAKEVVGVDIDKTAVRTALENSIETGLKDKARWIAGDLDTVRGEFDTVIQNPPFGVQRRGADRRFLEKALSSGKAVYSLHKTAQTKSASKESLKTHRNEALSTSFIARFIEKKGGHIKAVYPMVMTVPHMFNFHTKRKHEFAVNLYVIEQCYQVLHKCKVGMLKQIKWG